ncbi:MAG: AraC family transcriptional regulator [Cyanobacteria bacterium P01_F01_bin.116]
MRVNFTSKDIDEFFIEFEQKISASVQVTANETTFQMALPMGKGYVRYIRLRPGLEISIENLELTEPFILQDSTQFSRDIIEFKSSLSGHVKGDFLDVKDSSTYHMAPRQRRLGFAAHCSQWIECLPNQPLIHIDVITNISTLNTLVADQLDQVSQDFQTILNGQVKRPLSQVQSMSQAEFRAAEQILNCPYRGVTRKLYLESRALELIALQLPLELSEDTLNKVRHPLKFDDIDRIHQAKAILLENLINPPSLLELAQQVELNDYKLKQGFRQVFGTTAFGCLHQYRMELAKTLLEKGYSTVTEVAQAVGYTSTTSFSAAFKKKFGMSPRRYRLSA